MPIKKSYMKTKNVTRVTFKCPGNDASEICLVGDFNDWDTNATPMRKSKDGFSATMDLTPGQAYQFRYLIDGERWQSDHEADSFAPTPFPDAQNSVIHA